jgi:alkylhydroperoxidase family enzyme
MAHAPDWSTMTGRQCGVASNLGRLREVFEEFASEFRGISISSRLRELLILHTAWRAESEGLWSGHLETAMTVGVTDLQITAVQQGQIEAYVFTPKEKSVLRFVSRAKGFMALSNEDIENLKAHCDEREIAEILAVDCLYHMIAMLDVVLWTRRQPRGVY